MTVRTQESAIVIPSGPYKDETMQSEGLSFWLGVGGTTSLTPQQVKALADRIAAHLR